MLSALDQMFYQETETFADLKNITNKIIRFEPMPHVCLSTKLHIIQRHANGQNDGYYTINESKKTMLTF